MAEILNLRLARKRKARAQAGEKAARNRAVHGRSGAERAKAEAERQRAQATLDGHRREPEDGA